MAVLLICKTVLLICKTVLHICKTFKKQFLFKFIIFLNTIAVIYNSTKYIIVDVFSTIRTKLTLYNMKEAIF